MDALLRSLVAWHQWRTPSAVRNVIRSSEEPDWSATLDQLSRDDRARLHAVRDDLESRGIGASLLGDSSYPERLSRLSSAPPILYWVGNISLLHAVAIGVCGSRSPSEAGLKAARTLGAMAPATGAVLVAGNAVGIDAEAQGGSLKANGSVISVLAEGISHFRFRTGSAQPEYEETQVLAISQFPPLQPWSVGNAMTRNATIAALAFAMVVIEARDKGGTLAAGETALKLGRPVIALDFGDQTPIGNAMLIEHGARSARTPRELSGHLTSARASQPQEVSAQASLGI